MRFVYAGKHLHNKKPMFWETVDIPQDHVAMLSIDNVHYPMQNCEDGNRFCFEIYTEKVKNLDN